MTETVATHQTCPSCGAREALTEFTDGGTYCHSSCGYTKGRRIEMVEPVKAEYRDVRGIPADVCKLYGIQTQVDEQGEPVRYAFRYPGNVKYRGAKEKKFWWKEAGGSRDLFGPDWNAGSSKRLYLTEGEFDAASLYYALGQSFPVKAIPSAGVGPASLSNWYDYLNSFQEIVLCLDNDEAGQKAATKIYAALPEKTFFVPMTKHKDANAFLQAGDQEELKWAALKPRRYTPENFFLTPEQFAGIFEEPTYSFIPTGVEELDEKISGVTRGVMTLITAQEGIGKQLPVDTPIPTPSGFTAIGGLEPGDQVFGVDGKPCNVLAVSEVQWGVDCYRVEFSDGTSQVAGGPHKWGVYNSSTGNYHVKTTEEIFTEGALRGGVARWSVPIAKPVEYAERDLPIEPYLLGYWLGDGHSYSANITVGWQDVHAFENLMALKGFAVTSKKKEGQNYSFRLSHLTHGDLRKNHLIQNKHIPYEYMFASVAQRRELLRGLMDSDGSVAGVGCEFYNSNSVLFEQFVELARSLGYKVRSRSKEGKLYGVSKKTAYSAWFLKHGDEPVFCLPRKKEATYDCHTYRATRKTIRNVAKVDSVPSVCIQVDTDDSLYLCGEHYTATHNSELIGFFEHAVLVRADSPIAVMHLEETKAVVLGRIASYLAGENLKYAARHEGKKEQALSKLNTYAEDGKLVVMDMVADDSPYALLDYIRLGNAVYGIDYFFVDHIHQVSDQDSDDDERRVLDKLSSRIARMCRDLNIAVVVVSHVNDDGKTRSSRMIRKQAGIVIDLERDVTNEDEEIRNITHLTCSKNRPWSKTGAAGMLTYNVETGLISEYKV